MQQSVKNFLGREWPQICNSSWMGMKTLKKCLADWKDQSVCGPPGNERHTMTRIPLQPFSLLSEVRSFALAVKIPSSVLRSRMRCIGVSWWRIRKEFDKKARIICGCERRFALRSYFNWWEERVLLRNRAHLRTRFRSSEYSSKTLKSAPVRGSAANRLNPFCRDLF